MLPIDTTLSQVRRQFIHSVGEGTIFGLLDHLYEVKSISWEEMNKVRHENGTVLDKARVLIDLIIGKGQCASQRFICYLREEDRELAHKLGIC